MNEKRNHEKVALSIVEELVSRLEASHPSLERIIAPSLPSNQIVIGTLTGYEESPTTFSRTITKSNSMTVSFLVRNGEQVRVEINPRFSNYYMVNPTISEVQKEILKVGDDERLTTSEKQIEIELPKVWKRQECIDDNAFQIMIGPDFQLYKKELTIRKSMDNIRSDENLFLGVSRRVEVEKVDTQEKLSAWLRKGNRPKLPNWKIGIKIDTKLYPGIIDAYLVFISLENDTPIEASTQIEPTLFSCGMMISLIEGEIQPFTFKYDFDGFEEEYDQSYVRCLNCSGDYNEVKQTIDTKNFGIFIQNKLIPKSSFFNAEQSIIASFQDLINTQTSIEFLDSLDAVLHAYSEKCMSPRNEKEACDFENYIAMVDRISTGIDQIKSNSSVMKAFNLMNETFAEANKDYYSWRLFQICFIIALIPDIVNNENKNRAEVLHVATGGGKSEAYFGLVVFTSFYDRMNGKEFGVTAITKFPLRMLSVQQLFRISKIFIYAEIIRQKHSIPGDEFSVGYFVGESTKFPNHLLTRNVSAVQKGKVKGVVIRECPKHECNGQIVQKYDEKRMRILHHCESCRADYPLYFSDEEIFRFIPTFIVSTVDKHASFAGQRRYRNLIGGKIARCAVGHGFIPLGDRCEAGKKLKKPKCLDKGRVVRRSFCTSATIIIQDEMHLIKEGFGTIDSHFETTIEAATEEMDGNRYKNIAMTATITGAESQITELYAKDTSIFPARSPSGEGINDFFFEFDEYQNQPLTHRILIGLKPNNRDNQFASLLSLRILSQIISGYEEHLNERATEFEMTRPELSEVLNSYRCYLTYHGRKQDVNSMSYFLEDVVNSQLSDNKIRGRVLTGEKEIDYIADTIDIINNFKKKHGIGIHSTFATSVASHGVDINQWNLMMFQGIPRTTAEYIQAFSRVGRKYTGIVLVWFYPNRLRDVSYFRNFREYHEILQHKVEKVPIARYASLGIDQTITSMLCGSIINTIANDIEKPLYIVDCVRREVYFNAERRSFLNQLIQRGYRTDMNHPGAEQYLQKIPVKIDRRLNTLKTDNSIGKFYFPIRIAMTGDTSNEEQRIYFRTQTGMRGVQDKVPIKIESRHEELFATFAERGVRK